MLAILEANLGVFDVFALVAAIFFVVAGVLARPAKGSAVNAYATTVGWLGLAVFSVGFLFMTP